MEAMGTIGGGAIVVKRYQAGTTISNAGVPLIGSVAATTDLGMVEPMAANAALTARNVGLSVDTSGTVAATGITDTNDILVTVAVNPDLIIRAKMNNGTTEDTALALNATTAASAGGTIATGVTTIDDGAIWGFDGGNAGILRRADDTAGSVSINFENAIASGDNFLVAAGYPCGGTSAANAFLQLSTLLTQVDATATDADNDNFVIFDLEVGDEANDGRTNSFYNLIANQHLFGSTVTS